MATYEFKLPDIGEGVTEGGNQTMVADGTGVSVGTTGVTVGRRVSITEQEVSKSVIARSGACSATPRNDGKRRENIIFI